MRALGVNKSNVRIFTGSGHGQSMEIWSDSETLRDPDQVSVQWRIGNVVHAFTVTSMLKEDFTS
jgi:hypothetical protein